MVYSHSDWVKYLVKARPEIIDVQIDGHFMIAAVIVSKGRDCILIHSVAINMSTHIIYKFELLIDKSFIYQFD